VRAVADCWLVMPCGAPRLVRGNPHLVAWPGSYDGGMLFAAGGGNSCNPQAVAACLNAGDWTSPGLVSGKDSPRPSVRPGPYVVSGSGKCEGPCARMHRVNVSAARSSPAVGAGGPPRWRPTGCSLAPALSAVRTAGKNGFGSRPFEPGSGKFGVPFARMQSAYFTACVSADPELLGLREEPHAADTTAQTASAARRRPGGIRCSAVRSHRTVDNAASCSSFTFAVISLTQSLSMT
jgi:hypothetical protein